MVAIFVYDDGDDDILLECMMELQYKVLILITVWKFFDL